MPRSVADSSDSSADSEMRLRLRAGSQLVSGHGCRQAQCNDTHLALPLPFGFRFESVSSFSEVALEAVESEMILSDRLQRASARRCSGHGEDSPFVVATLFDGHVILIPVRVRRDVVEELEEVLQILQLTVLLLVEVGELLLELLVDHSLEFRKGILGCRFPQRAALDRRCKCILRHKADV